MKIKIKKKVMISYIISDNENVFNNSENLENLINKFNLIVL